MDEQTCRKCFDRVGKPWTSTASLDLQEGLCPVADGELWTCEITSEKIKPLGRVKIVGCR